MAKLHELKEKRKGDWGDNVRLIGLSIDQDVAALKKHVETKGWTSPEHYHVRNGKCTGSDDYGARGVPHGALIDKEGKIVFIGHPANRELEKDIDLLLADKPIAGKGTAGDADDEEDGEKEGADGTLNCSNEEADAHVKKFLELADAHCQTEEMKTAASGMMRAFCVLSHEPGLNPKTGEFIHKMTLHKVLVGKQEGIDAVKEKLKVFDDGPWKISE